jgi:hypothetical protein
MEGLLPKKRGPKNPRKLKPEVLEFRKRLQRYRSAAPTALGGVGY